MTRLTKSILIFCVALTVFALSRAALVLIHSQEFAPLTAAQIALAFVHGLRFDASSIAVFFIGPLLLMCLPFEFARRKGWFNGFAWLLYALTMGFALLLICDLIYFGFVGRHLGNELLLLGEDAGFVVGMAVSGYKWAVLGYLLFAALLFVLWKRLLSWPMKETARWMPVYYLVSIVVVVLIGRGGLTNKPISAIDAFTTGDTRFGNLVLNGVFTAAHAGINSKSVNHRFFEPGEALRMVRGDEPPLDPAYPMLKRYEGRKSGHNIVFIMLESWDPKYIDSFGGTHPKLTPFFDELTTQGVKFTNFYAAGQRSIEGVQSALVGLPILAGMPVLGSGLEVSNISRLGMMAKNSGYKTLLIQSSGRVSFRMGSIAAATGFDEFYGMEDIPLLLPYPDPQGARFGWDHDTLQFLKTKLDNTPDPFLSFVFTGTTHIEFPRLPPRFEIHPPSAKGESGFMNTLYYADWSLSEFFKAARRSAWFDNTIFILCADHTFGHYEKEGTFLEKFRIPFLIYAPAIYPPKVVNTVGSQLDIMPTIVDMLGFDQEFSALGESLFRKRDPYAFVTEGGSIIGLITPTGYLKHSLKNRMETGALGAPEPTPQDYDAMEKKLLAIDQVLYELIQANKWAR